MLTETQLKSIMPRCSPERAARCLPALNAALHRFDINTPQRAAAFIAQVAHESGEFRWLEELWGPTDAQRRYEPASSLAARLGNTRPGDGRRYKGRGPIQITGRDNYKRYGGLLDIDLVADPDQAAEPDVGFAIAGLYWATNNLNELADADEFVAITKRINGGTNGLADRQGYYARAKQVLAGGVFGDPPPLARGSGGIGLTTPLEELAPLPRGSEAVREDGGEDAGEDGPDEASEPARQAPAAPQAGSAKAAPKPRAGYSSAQAAGDVDSVRDVVAAKRRTAKTPRPGTPTRKTAARRSPGA